MTASQLPLNQILPGDCIDELARLPEKSVDLIFADPPYNLQLQNELWRPDQTHVDAVQDKWDKFDSHLSYDQFTRNWLSACRRVLKISGTLWVIGTYHNIYRVGTIMMDLGFWILNDVVWVKTNPMPNFRGVRFTNAHETLLWVQKKKGARYTFNYQSMKGLNRDKQMRSDWVIPICNGKERLRINGEKAHSTQKPEALLYRVIQSSSKPGDVVLDPFFGSGTTGTVAKKMHRNWIGIEKDPTYIEIAQARLAAIDPQPYSESVFTIKTRRDQPRIPFSALLENGLLQPGQLLFFETSDQITATITANGKLQHKTFSGSIHQVAKQIKRAPCNGWDLWHYLNEDGKLVKIDHLRETLRPNYS